MGTESNGGLAQLAQELKKGDRQNRQPFFGHGLIFRFGDSTLRKKVPVWSVPLFQQVIPGVVVMLFACVGIAAAQTGSISGKVVDSQGNAVAGATVSGVVIPSATAVPGPNGAPGFVPYPASGLSGADGSFTIPNTPAASLTICASKPGAALLNPCLWSDSPTAVTLAAGASASGISVVMANGVTIAIRVNDAKGLTIAHPEVDDVLVGTTHGNSPFIPGAVIARDSGGKTIGLVVPPSASVNLLVRSTNFALTDNSGAALASSVPVTAPASAAPAGGGGPTPSVTVGIGGAKAVTQ